MKSITFLILILTMCYSQSHAQDTTNTWARRTAFVVGSSLVFSFADYVAFNLLKKAAGAQAGGDFERPPIFNISRVLVQSAITYFLYKECGLSSAISFNLIWWT